MFAYTPEPSWSHLEIHSTEGAPDEEVAHLAGFLEGVLTGHLILMQWKNTMGNFCTSPSALCTKLEEFLRSNQLFMSEQMEKKEGDLAYWYQVRTSELASSPHHNTA